MYVCMYVCMYGMYVCMYVCMYVYECMYVCMHVLLFAILHDIKGYNRRQTEIFFTKRTQALKVYNLEFMKADEGDIL